MAEPERVGELESDCCPVADAVSLGVKDKDGWMEPETLGVLVQLRVRDPRGDAVGVPVGVPVELCDGVKESLGLGERVWLSECGDGVADGVVL